MLFNQSASIVQASRMHSRLYRSQLLQQCSVQGRIPLHRSNTTTAVHVAAQNLTEIATSPPSRPKDYDGAVETAVLFVHMGEPNFEHQVTRYFTNAMQSYYKLLPRSVIRWYVKAWQQTIYNQYAQHRPPIYWPEAPDQRQQLADRLRMALSQLIPEFGPYSCSFGYDQTQPSIRHMVKRLHSQSPDRVIVIPFYSNFWCFQSNNCFNHLTNAVRSFSQSQAPLNPRNRLAFIAGAEEQFARDRDVNWSVLDRLADHPFVADLWAHRIQCSIADHFPYDQHPHIGLVFAAPQALGYDRAGYNKSLSDTAARISHSLKDRHPWRIAKYNAWDQPFVGVPLGHWSIVKQMRSLCRQSVRNILIVPVTHLLPGPDLHQLMPSENQLRLIGAEQVAIAGAAGDQSQDSVMVHGLAEMVKNHLLWGCPQPSGAFRLRCALCYRPQCRHTRQLLYTDNRLLPDVK